MKKTLITACFTLLLLAGCQDDNTSSKAEKPGSIIIFATSAEYPPFEYYENGEIKGFDIELAQAVAKELGKVAIFEDMQFSTILAAIQNGSVDAGIATFTITPKRQKNFDFSDPYYTESLATVFPVDRPVKNLSQLANKKIAVQLGSTMEIWLKNHMPDAQIIIIDDNNLSIESLKSGLVDVVLVDGVQGATFSKKNPSLSYAIVAKCDTGYGIAFKKGTPIRDQINQALKVLKTKGTIKKLEKKWLEGTP